MNVNEVIFKREAIKAMEDLKDPYDGFSDRFDRSHVIDVLESIPPVDQVLVKVNLNGYIKVRLTDEGKDIYYHQYDHINEIAGQEAIKPSYPEVDEDGYTRFQLWRFMALYGEHIKVGKPNVILPTEMIYEGVMRNERI